jgi:hypothetical protein
MWHGLVRRVCAGVESDGRLLRRFAGQLRRTGVTHLLPALEVFCPWAAAAKKLVPQDLRYLVTFQGYEVYGNYAREIGLEESSTCETVANQLPAIAVSEDYAQRIAQEVGVERTRSWDSARRADNRASVAAPATRPRGTVVRSRHPAREFHRPAGHREGSTALCMPQNPRPPPCPLQLYVCGPTAFSGTYSHVCRQIAEELARRMVKFVPDELRSALSPPAAASSIRRSTASPSAWCRSRPWPRARRRSCPTTAASRA